MEERAAAQPHPTRAPGGPTVAHTAAARLAKAAENKKKAAAASSSAAMQEGANDEDDEVDASTLMESQREYYRTGIGLTASTFEPQRNTYYVCGRPVQVL